MDPENTAQSMQDAPETVNSASDRQKLLAVLAIADESKVPECVDGDDSAPKTLEKRPWSWHHELLIALAEGDSVSLACRRAGVSKQNAYRVRERNPSFAKAWDFAREHAADVLESTLYKRVLFGVRKPLTWRGEITGWTIEYPEGLSKFMLAGMMPDKYGKIGVEHAGPGGGPIELELSARRALEKVYGSDAPTLTDGAAAKPDVDEPIDINPTQQ